MILAEIGALGVGNYRDAACARGGDQFTGVLQRALVVVRQHQHLRTAQQRHRSRLQRSDCLGTKILFEVQTKQLLMLSNHTQFGDGRRHAGYREVTQHSRRLQSRTQLLARLVSADDSHQRRRSAQRRNVQRHVAGTARPILAIGDTHHRHRSLRRDPRGLAVPVPIQHQIANHEHSRLLKRGHVQFHHTVLRSPKILAAIIAQAVGDLDSRPPV